MVLETRARGGPYYYRARKVRGRVIKEYLGAGRAAELMAALDERARAERRAAAEERRAAMAAMETADAELDDWCRRVEVLARASLLGAGFRQHHRGDWRQRRGR